MTRPRYLSGTSVCAVEVSSTTPTLANAAQGSAGERRSERSGEELANRPYAGR